MTGHHHHSPSDDTHSPAGSSHADPTAFWEARYGERPRIWSGNPNRALVESVVGLTPGTALDLGCGEGADSLWLAEQGWRVTGIDLAAVALERAAAEAETRGIASDRITWQRADLAEWQPGSDERYDLVSACFLHAPVEVVFPRDEVLRRAAGTVTPGGHLLVVGHAGVPPWAGKHDHSGTPLPTNAEVLAALALDPDVWTTVIDENRTRPVTMPDGSPAEIDDAILLLRRTA
ncbi:class I SAM-dependent methyltransferase [Herbiconiux liukaitaii]|uniref:class I SAM-dependent methyltransferase n=1 Tax=Herbiconiux liukaitaii TaxID=3342799 RepID=UPI0035B85986